MKLPKYFRKNASLKTVQIIGKEWFDRVNGNSYNAVVVTVNHGLKSEFSFSLPFTYGYGEYYIQRTVEFLVKIGAVESKGVFQDMQRDGKIYVLSHCIENCKKSEVVAWGKTL